MSGKYELAKPDFEILDEALRVSILTLSTEFNALLRQGLSLADKQVGAVATKLNRARDLHERFSDALTAWIEFDND